MDADSRVWSHLNRMKGPSEWTSLANKNILSYQNQKSIIRVTLTQVIMIFDHRMTKYNQSWNTSKMRYNNLGLHDPNLLLTFWSVVHDKIKNLISRSLHHSNWFHNWELHTVKRITQSLNDRILKCKHCWKMTSLWISQMMPEPSTKSGTLVPV